MVPKRQWAKHKTEFCEESSPRWCIAQWIQFVSERHMFLRILQHLNETSATKIGRSQETLSLLNLSGTDQHGEMQLLWTAQELIPKRLPVFWFDRISIPPTKPVLSPFSKTTALPICLLPKSALLQCDLLLSAVPATNRKLVPVSFGRRH